MLTGKKKSIHTMMTSLLCITILLLSAGMFAACGKGAGNGPQDSSAGGKEKASVSLKEALAGGESADTGSTEGNGTDGDNTDAPKTPILLFRDDAGAAKLAADMEAGRIPAECRAMYDEMGSRPEVTVTDPETITELYNRFSKMTVGAPSNISITDCYHYISFLLQDGTQVGWSFEGTGILCVGQENYEVKDEGNLWFVVRGLQEEAMGYEETVDGPEPDPAGTDTPGTENGQPDETAGTDAAGDGSGQTGEAGDFDVSHPKWNWINWDADGDGTEEELEFTFHDLGDEAPGYIEITLYAGAEELDNMIDRAYGLNRIFAKEDAEGPYLQIYYAMGDFYSHDAEGECILRLRDGELAVIQEDQP